MGIRDRLGDTLGNALGFGLDVVNGALEKAAGRDTDPTPGTAMTLATKPAALPPEAPRDDPKALLHDPFALIDQLGYRDRPTGLTYQTLREMAKRVPTYTGIEQTRITQVASFGQPQLDKRDPGFEIQLRDDKATPDDDDRKRMIVLTDWMMQTGSTWGPSRDDFRTFLRKTVRDSLELDQLCFEIVANRKGVPAEFYAMDGGTVRLADTPPGADQQDPNLPRYVQVYDEIIIAEFSPLELCFGVRNPRSDIRVNGYGYSELEMLLNVITASLWAFEYNKKFFSQGTSARGILNFKGSVPDSKIDAFRRQWKMMIAGVHGAHRTPMTNVDELQWTDLGSSNRDMEFSAWMDWLIKITCAVMQFDPAEINFTYGNTGQGSQMFATPVDQKLKQSKDRGLRPLLSDIAHWINVNLIWRMDPRYKFAFVGLDAKSADQAVELGGKKVKYLMTVDELRAEDDLDPLPDGKGEVILDPTWLQNAQMAGQEGMEGEGEDMAPPPGVPGVDDQEEDEGDGGFDQVFGERIEEEAPEAQKSAADQLRDSRRALEAGQLFGDDELKKATIRVYDIDL